MRCHKQHHRFYAGVDMHARSMFTHILDQKGKTVFEKDLPAEPSCGLRQPTLEPCRRFRGRVQAVDVRPAQAVPAPISLPTRRGLESPDRDHW